jgi:integrase
MSENLRYWIFDRYLPTNLKVRDESTRGHYCRAVRDFGNYLGRDPELSDLSDDTLAGFINWLDSRGLSRNTTNERFGRIRAFWNWAARKRVVDSFPTVGKLPVPERNPEAWRENELVRLFNGCRSQRGYIADIPAWRWWFTIHGFWWNTGERFAATLALRVADLRLDEGVVIVPAAVRKGKRKIGVYNLWPDLVAMLREMLPPKTGPRELVFPWDRHRTTFYNHYSAMLQRMNLPHDRYHKPHAMRVSHATWRHLAGDDASKALGHSDPATTDKSYLDKTLTRREQPKLFRPW